MSFDLSPIRKTAKIDDIHTYADIALGAGLGALTVFLSNKYNFPTLANISTGLISNMRAGFYVGTALSIAYKVNDYILNSLFATQATTSAKEQTVTLGLVRKAVEIIAAAGVVSVALPWLVPSISMSFSTYVAFSALESMRPLIASGDTEKAGPLFYGFREKVKLTFTPTVAFGA